MISIGPSLRRKSFQRVEPSLPKPSPNRQPSSNGRTSYKQLKLPVQQLGEYHKRHLFTMGTLSTDKSLSRIHSEQQVMKQSRYDYDHHNTDSIAQLFQHKNDSNIHSQKLKLSQGNAPSEPHQPSTEQKMSLEEESIAATQRENNEEQEPEGKEGENYDDYVLGDKVEDEIEERPQKISKKYTQTHSTKTLLPYQSSSESQLRMQRQHILNERRRLAQINEDKEIALLMAQYKNNKQQMLAHCARKHEATRIIASMRHPHEQVENKNKVEKSLSLPALKPKKELIVPQDYYQQKPAEPWKNTKNLIAKNVQQHSQQQKAQKLKYTLSYGQLGFGKKKVRTICEQDILQQQMASLEQIKSKLRAKGIPFDANKLKKGLLNQKKQPYNQKHIQYPQKRLPSNPIYKKFPL